MVSCPTFKELKIEDYDKAFDLDVRALVHITIECLPLILTSKGNILNISTIGATHRGPNLSMYSGLLIISLDVGLKNWQKME